MSVKCSIKEAESLPGISAFDIEIDADLGLDVRDIDYVIDFPSGPDAFTDRVVQVNVYGPSTTDQTLLDKLVRGVVERLRGWNLEAAVNNYVPSEK